MNSRELDYDSQKALIELIFNNPDVFSKVKPILNPEYFDKRLQPSIRYLIDFTNDYTSLPLVQQLNDETHLEYHIITQPMSDGIKQSLVDSVEIFCKTQALNLAIIKCADMIEKGNTTGIDKIIKDAEMISIKKDLGINYWENSKEWLTKLDKEMGLVSTGWKTLDECLYGGFSWGQLNYVVAASGGGKSLCLTNLALNWSLLGYNVIYLTLELDKELIGKRLVAMNQNIAYREISHRIDDVSTKISNQRIKDKPGVIQIIEIKENNTPNDIEALLQDFELSTGLTANIIIVDYADILKPADRRIDINNIHMRDKAIAEELRAIARQRTHEGKLTMCVTASQLTKDSTGADVLDYDMSKIAGGSPKVNYSDNIFSVRTNQSLRTQGMYEFQFIKCRNSGSTGKKFKMKYNVDTLRISDLEEIKNDNPTQQNIDSGTALLESLKQNG